jgi:hypothetical protein
MRSKDAGGSKCARLANLLLNWMNRPWHSGQVKRASFRQGRFCGARRESESFSQRSVACSPQKLFFALAPEPGSITVSLRHSPTPPLRPSLSTSVAMGWLRPLYKTDHAIDDSPASRIHAAAVADNRCSTTISLQRAKLRGRQEYREYAAAMAESGAAPDPESTSMPVHHIFYQREPEPATEVTLGGEEGL